MRVLFILTTLLILQSPARAAESLREILSVKSVAELESRVNASSALTQAQESCSAELKARLLPRSCFRELEFSKMASANRSKRQRLTRICLQNAKVSRSRLDLSRPTDELPPECQLATAQRLEDLQYIDEESRPEVSVMRTLGPELEKTSL